LQVYDYVAENQRGHMWEDNVMQKWTQIHRCGRHYFEVHIPRNTKMRTYFVYSCIYGIYLDVGRFRGSNKRWNVFIYPKHVLMVSEHSPIRGTKMRICFLLYPSTKWPCRRECHTN
jgi:hypothetical protein